MTFALYNAVAVHDAARQQHGLLDEVMIDVEVTSVGRKDLQTNVDRKLYK